MTKGRALTPRTEGARSRMLSLYVTTEKWEWVDRMAKKNRTSKAEILRLLLNMGLTQFSSAKKLRGKK